jgi:hypothetical protein
MATVMITEEQLKNTLSLQLVNCDKFVNSLFKYMSASRVLEILENEPHQIGFVSPESWYDPYETKYLNTDYSALHGYKQPKIYCFCARMDTFNEEASWKIYKKEKEPLLRLRIKTMDFLSGLNDFAKEHQCDIYFSRVDYRLKKNEIDELYKPSSLYYHEFFDSFDDKQYVRIMSLKRWAYRYENEYRIFIIPRKEESVRDCIKNGVLFVPVPLQMILNFTFYPASKTDDSLASQIEKAKYEAEYKLIKERIVSCYPEAKVAKSNLYSKIKKVERIEV